VPELAPGGLTYAQISAMTALARGTHSDLGARVPEGTLASLVTLGFAYKKGDNFWPLPVTLRHVRDWERVGNQAKVVGQLPPAMQPKRLGDVRTLHALKEQNPSREGSKAHAFYELTRSSATVEEYFARGGAKAYLAWFVARGMVRIGD
jgi:hypothetical protein